MTGRGMGEGVVGREGWEREWRAGKDGGESSGQGGMGEGVEDSEGGDKEMVGNEGGGMEWMLTGNTKRRRWSSSSSLVSLRRILAVSLTAICACSPVEPQGRGCACRCRSCALVVRQPLLAVFVVARQSMLLVGHWPSFAARGLLRAWWWIGRLTSFGRPVLFEVVGVA